MEDKRQTRDLLDSREYRFRRARPADAKKVVTLLQQMFSNPPHGFNEGIALHVVRKFSTSRSVFHLVVEHNGELIASVIGYFVDYARFGRRMLLEDFVVDQAWRGNGLGTSMLDYMKMIAIERKCTGIVLHTGKHNLGAKRFYSRHGMEQNVMFKLDLPETSK